MSRLLDNYKRKEGWGSSGTACANPGISASQAGYFYHEQEETIIILNHILPHGIQVGHIPTFWNRVSEKELTETPKVSPARVFASSPGHMIEKPFPRYTHFSVHLVVPPEGRFLMDFQSMLSAVNHPHENYRHDRVSSPVLQGGVVDSRT